MATINTFNYPLYEFAVGWFKRQAPNPIDFLAPVLKVDGKLGTFPRYPQGYAFRSVNTDRALFSPPTTVSVDAEQVPFKLASKGLRIGVDDDELVGAGNEQAARDQLAQAKAGSLLSTFRTSLITEDLATYRAAVPALSGKGHWSGSDASNPIEELRAVCQEFIETNGVNPNRILMSDNAWNILANNADVLDMVAYNDAKVLTHQLLLKLLYFDPDAEGCPVIKTSTVPVGTAKPGPGVAFKGANALGTDVWLTYVDEGDLVGNMCGLRQLQLNDDAPIDSVTTVRVEEDGATYYQVKGHHLAAVTAPTCVTRLSVS